MKGDYTIVIVTPEIMMPELGEPACGANFRGGLGIRSGDDIAGLVKRGIKAKIIIPLYESHWVTREKINYDETPAKKIFEIRPEIAGQRKVVNVRKIDCKGIEVFGLCSSDFNLLYTADRWQRLQQEILLGHAVPALLKRLDVKPDIIWLQEGHTALTIPAIIKDPDTPDPYFEGTRFLFTTHTPCPEGMEKFSGQEEWVKALGINEKYHNKFLRGGVIDMTWGAMALADMVAAVSGEHAEVTKKMFPEFAKKVVAGIRNGSDRELWLSLKIKAVENNLNLYNLWEAQQADKEEFIEYIARKHGVRFDPRKPLIGLIRRFAWYKNQYPMLAPIIRAICAERGVVVDGLEGLGMQIFLAGRAHESDAQCLGWMAKFTELMLDSQLVGKLVFDPDYNLELLKYAARGLDLGINCPKPEWEACGTSDQRWAINGRVNLTPPTGGAKEYIEEFDPLTGKGNGFFLEPYESMTIYRKLKIFSDLYYNWIKGGDPELLQLNLNSFEAGKQHDIVFMIEKYEKIFERLLRNKNSG